MGIMDLPAIGLAHFITSTFAVLAGAGGFTFRKDSFWHRTSGNLFFWCMLILSASGLYMSIARSISFTLFLSILAAYLVSTGWMAAKRRGEDTGLFEKLACFAILLTGVGAALVGREVGNSTTGQLDGLPAGAFYTLAALAAYFGALDFKIIIRGLKSEKHRIARHLWRMSSSMLLAVTIFFLGNNEVLPDGLRHPIILTAPIFFVSILMLFWLIRVLKIPTWTQGLSSKVEAEQDS